MLAKKTVMVKIVVLALVALLLLPSASEVFAVSHSAINDPLELFMTNKNYLSVNLINQISNLL